MVAKKDGDVAKEAFVKESLPPSADHPQCQAHLLIFPQFYFFLFIVIIIIILLLLLLLLLLFLLVSSLGTLCTNVECQSIYVTFIFSAVSCTEFCYYFCNFVVVVSF